MSLDGPIRAENGITPADGVAKTQAGYLAGSRALDSLDKLITSTETYFHPSNSGHWTLAVCRTNVAHLSCTDTMVS